MIIKLKEEERFIVTSKVTERCLEVSAIEFIGGMPKHFEIKNEGWWPISRFEIDKHTVFMINSVFLNL